MSAIPKPIFNRLVFIILIGIGCFIFGFSYSLYADDRIMLILSIALFTSSLIKGISLYKIAKGKAYDMIIGTCTYIKPAFIGRYQEITIVDNDDNEMILKLNRNIKIQVGCRYRFYFRNQTNVLGIKQPVFLQKAIYSDHFLGMEEII